MMNRTDMVKRDTFANVTSQKRKKVAYFQIRGKSHKGGQLFGNVDKIYIKNSKKYSQEVLKHLDSPVLSIK